MVNYILNQLLIFTTAYLIKKLKCCQNNRGGLDIEKLVKKREVKIGKVTYIISSVFNPKAKGDVIDKISRLIDRDVVNIPLDDAVNK